MSGKGSLSYKKFDDGRIYPDVCNNCAKCRNFPIETFGNNYRIYNGFEQPHYKSKKICNFKTKNTRHESGCSLAKYRFRSRSGPLKQPQSRNDLNKRLHLFSLWQQYYSEHLNLAQIPE